MNLTNKKSTRSTLALVLAISVGVHVVGILIFGVMKIAEVVMREEVAFEAPPPPPPVEEIPEFEVNLEQRNEESSPPRPNPITVDSPDIALPALDIDVNVDSYSSYGRGSGGFGSGSGTGTGGGIREMAITAKLFGTEVTATKLGVLLDISFSTHRAIDKVVNEINKKFKDAVIVLAPGCVIGKHDSTVYPLKDFKKGTKAHKVGKLSTETFTERLLERNKEFDKIWGKLEKDERGYILFAENPNSKQTGNGGSNDALEFLRDEGVDTIYWFADFQDQFLAEPTEAVIKSMKRGRITVIMHDFVAPLGAKNKEGQQNQALLKLQQKLADETKGKFFLKEL